MKSRALRSSDEQKRQRVIEYAYPDAHLRELTEYCFIQIVNASARTSGFYDIWTSSLANRTLFYVRAVRHMHDLVYGRQDVAICAADDELQEQFDNWRWHLCNFAHLPQRLVVKSLASVLVEYLDGKLYDGAEWQFGARSSVPSLYAPLKPRHRVGTMISLPDPDAFEDVERQLEDVLAGAFDRTRSRGLETRSGSPRGV